jgi:hypothetical protein
MFNRNEDEAALQANIRNLERELAQAKQTARDDFAKSALIGYLSSWAPHEEPCEFSSSIAEDCFKLADAMMEARAK